MILWVYNRWGTQTGTVGDVSDLVFDDELGSLDSIEFDTPDGSLAKGDYILWRDEFGEWHEHIVRSVEAAHAGGKIVYHVYAVNSIAELNLSYKDDRESYGFQNSVAWQRLLEDTRWTVGSIANLGTNNIKFYHQTVYEGVVEIVKIWGGEISTSLTVGATGVTARRVNHQRQRGADDGLLFTYGFDMDNVQRSVELDDVYTRIHVFGKGEPTYGSDGNRTGNGRRITFASINGGRDYVEDSSAMQTWGVIGKNGVRQHSEGVFVFDQCEDVNELLRLGRAKLEEVKQPRVSYKCNVAILADAGMDFKNARTGDTCYIRDRELDERLSGRIMHVKRYLTGTKPTEITIGNIRRVLGNVIQSQSKAISNLQNGAAKWDGVAEANREWLRNMQDNLNDMMNVNGGYAYWEEGDGIIVYDRPVDKNPTMCIQLKGAGFRIANSKKSNGEWDFKTFGTGDGFTADVINVGTLVCGTNRIDLDNGTITLDQGTITDKKGNNTWNLSTGSLTTTSMTAKAINASGTFECGSTSAYGIRLNSSGQLAGFRQGTQVGYIDYSSSMHDVNTGKVYYGIQLQAQGSVRISAPLISVAATSDIGVTSTHGTTTGSSSSNYHVTYVRSTNGNVSWGYGTHNFINGICTGFSGGTRTQNGG